MKIIIYEEKPSCLIMPIKTTMPFTPIKPTMPIPPKPKESGYTLRSVLPLSLSVLAARISYLLRVFDLK